MSDIGKEARQPVYVLWWTTLHLRWWDEEEILYANAQGKFSNGQEDYRLVAAFHATAQRYGGRSGGRVRRSSNGFIEVQERSVFGQRPGSVVRICTTSP